MKKYYTLKLLRMKKFFLFIFCFLFSFGLKSQTVVNIPDASLKIAIRQQLGLGANDTIKTNHMLLLHYLDISGDNVGDLTGLQTATNLDTLKANQHYISTFTQLSGLLNLKYLDISHYLGSSINAATVLSPLQNLSNLRYLNISQLKTGLNVSYLSGLSSLRTLKANSNQNLTNLSGISGLTNLDSLILSYCSLSDITAISGLINLTYLNLYNNQLSAEDLPKLYNLDKLKPVLDLTSNGVGFATDSINLLYSQLDSMPNSPGNILFTPSEKYITIGDLRLKCFQLDTISANNYKASGDIKIQYETYSNNWENYIYFSGSSIYIDKSADPNTPVLSGNGTMTNFLGDPLYSGSFNFTVILNNLNPDVLYGADFYLDGFTPKCSKITLTTNLSSIWVIEKTFTLFELKYPIDKIVQYIFLKNNSDSVGANNFIPSELSGVHRTVYNSVQYTHYDEILFNVNLPGPFNFGTFAVQDLNYKYQGDTMSGGFRVKFPGFPGDEMEAKIGAPTSLPPAEIIDEPAKWQDSKAAYTPFLDLDIRAQFANGSINGFNCALGVDIPLGTTGLKLTSVRAGVDDLQSPSWRAMGLVNIETGLTVPVLGPAVSIENFGVKFGPVKYLEGSGIVKVFGWQMVDGKLVYNHEKGGLSLGGYVNIADILEGTLHSSLRLNKFTGTLLGSLTLPNNLPWKFSSLSAKQVGSVYGQINGLSLLAEVEAFGLPLATRIDYGNPSFPYIYFYLGSNLESLYQLIKSTTIQNFNVEPNSSRILIVAGNDANLFDYAVVAPNGTVYNAQNTYYKQDSVTKQTIMVVNNPPPGYWSFNTQQTGAITISVDAINLPPVGSFTSPSSFHSLDTNIALTCNDYMDTLTIGIYYDNDNKDFDGNVIFTYYNVTTPNVNYQWNPWNVADGEYYIYATIDDGKNVLKRFYANGSVIVSKGTFTHVPQNLTAISFTDSIKVSWDYNPDTLIYQARVFCKDLSSGDVIEVDVLDTNFTFLKDIEAGKSYEIWAKYSDFNLLNGAESNKVTIGTPNTQLNNPPHFVNDNSEWIFTQGQASANTLEIVHLDGGNVTYSLIGDTLGFVLNQNNVSWTPDTWHAGTYKITFVVADDSLATDTMEKTIFVLPLQQSQVTVSFNSPQFYIGSSSFLIINDLNIDTNFVVAQLKNLRTGQEISLNCVRSDETSFVGYFSASGTFTGLLTGDTIRATYTSGGNTYTAVTIYCHYAMGTKPDKDEDNAVKLYPNPNNGNFYIQFENENKDKVVWDVFDMTGRHVSNGTFSENTKYIDLKNIAEGNYVILLRKKNTLSVKKFIVAK